MKKDKGFTLVELLAVIVVLAVIMVIASTSIINVIKKSRADAFASTARIVYNALKQCEASRLTADECMATIDISTDDYTLYICKGQYVQNGACIDKDDASFNTSWAAAYEKDTKDYYWTYGLLATSSGKFKSSNMNLRTMYEYKNGSCATGVMTWAGKATKEYKATVTDASTQTNKMSQGKQYNFDDNARAAAKAKYDAMGFIYCTDSTIYGGVLK